MGKMKSEGVTGPGRREGGGGEFDGPFFFRIRNAREARNIFGVDGGMGFVFMQRSNEHGFLFCCSISAGQRKGTKDSNWLVMDEVVSQVMLRTSST